MSTEENSSLSITNEQLNPVDSVIEVKISKDRLNAFLNITPPENGGNAPDQKMIEAALAKYKITYGINYELISSITQSPVYGTDIPIAQGDAPIDGEDGSYKFLFETERKLKPKLRDNGKVDFFNLDIAINVKKDQDLCILKQPTEGTIGVSVTGDKLSPRGGKAIPYFLGKNTYLNEDGTLIKSSINGQVKFAYDKINVNETFFIRDNVDISTGNIKVYGNVEVNGMVLPGFRVEADGDIDIRGTVESATIKAGGKITLHSGVTGSTITCAEDFSSRFIENCNLIVRGNIKAEYIINSSIKCGKNLDITGMYGKFVGGSCVVGNDLTVRTIGSPSCIKTEIELGTDPSNISRQHEIKKHLPELTKQINSISSLISLLKQYEAANRLDDEKRSMLSNAVINYESFKLDYEREKAELEDIEEQIKTKGYGKVICKDTIFPGTKIKIGNAVLVVDDSIINMTVSNVDGEIQLSAN